MKRLPLLTFFICLSFALMAQKYEANWSSLNKRPIPEWFSQDKFGIFIHWGVYAVPAYAPVIKNDGNSYSEWYWYRINEGQKNFKAFHEKVYGKDFSYPEFEKSFTAELFEPDYWASIFKKSGARYVVLTSKHHDGYTLWNSPQADSSWGRTWNAVEGTPKRDLLGDLSNAVRNAGLKMGYYYSLYEWFNPLWKTDKKKYVTEHMTPQFKDLVTRYKPAVIFSDGEWELTDTAWQSPALLAWLFNESPVAKNVVVNDRWGSNTRGKNTGATYTTSEYGSGMDASVTWEESRGIGHSYGYNRNEKLEDYKTGHELILILSDVVARGGNLLLDIGPTADGRIPVIMQQRLLEIGNWLQVNGEAIYNTTAWKTPYQWSAGKKPEQKGDSFMSGYDISELTKPKEGAAFIEQFYTRKGRDLYCLVPAYKTSVTISDFKPAAGTQIMLLEGNKTISGRQAGKDFVIDLSTLKPNDISTKMFVIRLKGTLPPSP